MVEKSQVTSSDRVNPTTNGNDSPPITHPFLPKGCERRPSFKERHPKFRKSSTPDYLLAAETMRSVKLSRQNSETSSDTSAVTTTEELPLDMSIKKPKKDSPPPPPPYRFTPLRQHSPPNPSLSPGPNNNFNSSSSPLYKNPPPYPSVDSLPPPPSYEDATVKCTYPTRNSPPPVAAVAPVLKMTSNVEEKQPPFAAANNEEKRTVREITIITNSYADPLLDEHFRRSLGANYKSLFKKKDDEQQQIASSTSSPPVSPPNPSTSSERLQPAAEKAAKEEVEKKDADPVKAFQEDMDMEGYTVEDHFAKALGDTWVKLQAAEESKKNSSTDSKKSSTTNANSSTSSTSGSNKTPLVAS